MTIQALIDKIQEEKPNSFSDEKLLSFVNEIEKDVAEQLQVETATYENIDDTELLAPAPYDRLYSSYVKAMIDYANEEYASYENNQIQHVQDFRDFVDWIVRTKQVLVSRVPARFKHVF